MTTPDHDPASVLGSSATGGDPSTPENPDIIEYSHDAVRTLFEEQHKRVRNMIAKSLPTGTDVDAVANEVWREFVERWEQDGRLHQPEALLVQTAKWRCSDMLRRLKVAPINLTDDPDALEGTAANLWVSSEFSDQLIARQDVIRALRDLPQRQREVLVWRYYGDLTLRQAAALMSSEVHQVRYLHDQAIMTLRQSGQLASYRPRHTAGGARP